MKLIIKKSVIILLVMTFASAVFAQAPTISYTGSPYTFTVGSSIPTLTPTVTGSPTVNGQAATFAGTGTAGFTNGTGTGASFNQPIGAAIDAQGNIYISDVGNEVIRKITPAGVVTTYAGLGTPSHADGTGTSAGFYHPVQLCVDNGGNMYVADEDNNMIRKIVLSTGVVTTIAGQVTAGYTNASSGTAAQFNLPCGVAVDLSGNVFVADYSNNAIRKITPAGLVSTFAGSVTGVSGSANGTGTAATFNHPYGLAIDANSNLYVVDRGNNTIRMITPGAVVTTLAGQVTAGYANGTGTAAQFNTPSGITIDQSGNLYIADELNNRIRKVVIATGAVTTLSGTGASGSANGVGTVATFYDPFAMATDANGNIFVGDYGYNLVRKVVTTAYTVSPALPAGLSLDVTTGKIDGTPTVSASTSTYTITAYNGSGTGTASVNITVNTSNGSPSQNQNYVIANIIRQSGIVDDVTLSTATSDKTKVQSTILYLDGLGRDIQTTQAQASPLGNDIVQSQTYDQYGREINKYLSYTPTTAASGGYRSTAISDQATFYNSPPTGIVQIPTGTQVAYSATRFESSPLTRPLEQGSPGLNNQLGGGHTVTNAYNTNTSSDAVKEWMLNSSGNGASYSAVYPAGTLFKTTTTDENQNNNAVIIFKNMDGQVLSRWQQNGAGIYLVTDYIYDDLGNLCYVIPPLPSASTVGSITNPAVSMPTSFLETDNVFLNFFYGYHYDGLHRPTSKKIPGQDWKYIVYNNMDEPILTQDANQRAMGVWMVAKYDVQGRIAYSGEYASASSPSSLQTTANGNNTNLLESFTNGTAFYGYTHNSWPDISSGTGNKALKINYYDSYSLIANSSINPGSSVFTAPNPTIDSLDKAPRNLPIATLVNVLGTPNYLFTVTHYDKYGRVVKTIGQHYQGGISAYNKYDTEDSQYSFQSLPTKTVRNHFQSTSTSPQLAIYSSNFYDHQNRMLMSKQQFVTPTNTGQTITTAKFDYNEIGQKMTTHLHSTSPAINPVNSSFLQHVDYRYNARGWLTKINDPASLVDQTYSSVIDIFSEQLDFDQNTNGYSTATPQYNGNISTTKWQTYSPAGSGITQEIKGYIYSYDPLNRLTASVSKESSLGDNRFNETVTYDELGNILTLSRNNGGSVPLNSLIYNYTTGGIRGNILRSVSDNGTVGESQASTYTFDSNGSITGDTKRTVSGMTYNEIGLPAVIPLTSKTLYYLYDATGKKLERISKVSGTVTSDRSYDNGIEYNSSTIEFVHIDQGRALAPTGGNSAYSLEYQLTDHLGNIRASFSDLNNDNILQSNEITQVVDYYPFGRQATSYVNGTNQRYTYNGKELQDDIAEYDYGERFYDEVIGRWNVIDPMAEKARRWTPYRYGFNNPVRNIDPDGMYEWTDYTGASHNNEFEPGSVGTIFDASIDPNTGQKGDAKATAISNTITDSFVSDDGGTKGTDVVTQQNTTYFADADDESSVVTIKAVTITTTVTVDANGVIAQTVTQQISTSTVTVDTAIPDENIVKGPSSSPHGGVVTKPFDNKSELGQAAQRVADFKKANKGASPIMSVVAQNKKNGTVLGVVSATLATAAAVAKLDPETAPASGPLGAAASATGAGSAGFNYETDPEKIKIYLKSTYKPITSDSNLLLLPYWLLK